MALSHQVQLFKLNMKVIAGYLVYLNLPPGRKQDRAHSA